MQKQLTHLTHLRASVVIMQAYNSRFEEFFTNPSGISGIDHIDILPPLDGSVTDFMRYRTYREFVEYASYNDACTLELVKLSSLLKGDKDIHHPGILEWFNKNTELFGKIFNPIHTLNSEMDSPEQFYLHSTNEYLIKSDFLPVITLFQIMWELSSFEGCELGGPKQEQGKKISCADITQITNILSSYLHNYI